jgi:hypothetical protein
MSSTYINKAFTVALYAADAAQREEYSLEHPADHHSISTLSSAKSQKKAKGDTSTKPAAKKHIYVLKGQLPRLISYIVSQACGIIHSTDIFSMAATLPEGKRIDYAAISRILANHPKCDLLQACMLFLSADRPKLNVPSTNNITTDLSMRLEYVRILKKASIDGFSLILTDLLNALAFELVCKFLVCDSPLTHTAVFEILLGAADARVILAAKAGFAEWSSVMFPAKPKEKKEKSSTGQDTSGVLKVLSEEPPKPISNDVPSYLAGVNTMTGADDDGLASCDDGAVEDDGLASCDDGDGEDDELFSDE